MMSPPEEGGLKEAIDLDNNISISESTLRSILTPQLKNMSLWYKDVCECECCIYSKSMHSSLLSWRDCYLKNIKDLVHNSQKKSMVKCLTAYLRQINYVMLHGSHIYTATSEIYMDTMCAYPLSQHTFPHWKCVLHCCANLPFIDRLYQ